MGSRIIDVLYESRRADRFHDKNYEFVKKFAYFFHKPRFNLKNSRQTVKNLTYRKVNYWDTKGLVSSVRKTKETGWRKFSFVDVMKLHILTDLKKIGLNTEKIKHVLDSISVRTIVGHNPVTKEITADKFLELEYCICGCLCGEKILLLVHDDGEAMLLSEQDIVSSHFFFDEAEAPVIILPFFFYVKEIWAIMGKGIDIRKDSTIEELITSILTEEEKKVLKIIREKAYREIVLKRSNDDKITINAKTKRTGKITDNDVLRAINTGDYHSVTVITKEKHKVQLIKNDSIKI